MGYFETKTYLYTIKRYFFLIKFDKSIQQNSFLKNQAPEIHDLAEFPVEDQDKPKPIPHESFLAKKAKMEQNPATQSFLDLKLLKRDKDTETEKVEEEEDEDETEEVSLLFGQNFTTIGDILQIPY